MEQKRIYEILEDFKSNPNTPVLMNLNSITQVLGIKKFFEQDIEGLLKIIPNHVWYIISTGFCPYFVDLEGFNLLYKFALDYEKSIEKHRNYERKIIEEFLKTYGIKEDIII